ncbi:hypothetical protein QP028_01375 [Corynebacterium suedekumii]|nr:hypothetical protein QP028_01375 [Corynebacterium suedekumii]
MLITTIANGTFLSLGGAADFGWTMYEPHTPETVLPGPDALWPSLFLWQLAGFLLFAALWKWRFRRGPLEGAVHRVVERTVVEPAARGSGRPSPGPGVRPGRACTARFTPGQREGKLRV